MTVLEHIKDLTQTLSAKEREELAAYLEKPEPDAHPKKEIKSLRGSWKGKFPEDFDLDAELKEIRSEWEKEIEEIMQ